MRYFLATKKGVNDVIIVPTLMIEHHQGAIDMSKVELEAGTDAEMKTMAQQIITAQQAEIATLRTFVQNHPVKPANQQSMPGNSMETMHNQMKSMAMSGKVDHDFASMMKVHHQGAVAMAQEALTKGKHAEIKQMAQQMTKLLVPRSLSKMMYNFPKILYFQPPPGPQLCSVKFKKIQYHYDTRI